MTLTVVRDQQVENDIMALLRSDPQKLWNITKLTKELEVPRGKVERALNALDAQHLVMLDDSVGNSWVVRLPPTQARTPSKGPKRNSNRKEGEGVLTPAPRTANKS